MYKIMVVICAYQLGQVGYSPEIIVPSLFLWQPDMHQDTLYHREIWLGRMFWSCPCGNSNMCLIQGDISSLLNNCHLQIN